MYGARRSIRIFLQTETHTRIFAKIVRARATGILSERLIPKNSSHFATYTWANSLRIGPYRVLGGLWYIDRPQGKYWYRLTDEKNPLFHPASRTCWHPTDDMTGVRVHFFLW